jgi:hypothetical protein
MIKTKTTSSSDLKVLFSDAYFMVVVFKRANAILAP